MALLGSIGYQTGLLVYSHNNCYRYGCIYWHMCLLCGSPGTTNISPGEILISCKQACSERKHGDIYQRNICYCTLCVITILSALKYCENLKVNLSLKFCMDKFLKCHSIQKLYHFPKKPQLPSLKTILEQSNKLLCPDKMSSACCR